MAAPMISRKLRTLGSIVLVVAGLVTLGIIQGALLEIKVIESTTTSPDPETAVVIFTAIAILLCAGIVASVVWLRRAHRGNTNQRK